MKGKKTAKGTRGSALKNADNVIVYDGASVKQFPVLTDGETVWLTLAQMALLFGRDMSVIGKHVKNVFAEGELPEEGFRQILPKNGKGRPETIFALDVIISVGYRVKSKEGVRFRQWATKCLREIMLGRLRRELMNEKAGRRLDAVGHRLTQVENGLEVIVQQLSEDPEPFLSKDRKMIGFSVG